jgi:hypothetical protein
MTYYVTVLLTTSRLADSSNPRLRWHLSFIALFWCVL